MDVWLGSKITPLPCKENTESVTRKLQKIILKDTYREKDRQIKLQRLQKVQIQAFGLLLQQMNSL